MQTHIFFYMMRKTLSSTPMKSDRVLLFNEHQRIAILAFESSKSVIDSLYHHLAKDIALS